MTSILEQSRSPTVRESLQTIADAFKVTLGAADDAGLALTVNARLPVTLAPGRHGRIAACFRIAEVGKIKTEVWISALSEAASWGLDGEVLRFVVVDRYFVLLWTPLPAPQSDLLPRLHEVIATALAVSDLAHRH